MREKGGERERREEREREGGGGECFHTGTSEPRSSTCLIHTCMFTCRVHVHVGA